MLILGIVRVVFMNEEELKKIKDLPLNEMWVNAFSLIKPISKEVARNIGLLVIEALRSNMIEHQNETPPKYPYEIVYRFHSS